MRVQLEPMFVLHRRAYGETSSLLEAFSRDYGKIGLVAKGAHRARSPLRGLLQPFVPLLGSWSGRGELATLTAAEAGASIPMPARSALFSALYMNELVMRLLTRHDPHPELFDNYAVALADLVGGTALEATGTSDSPTVSAEGHAERCLRLFEKRLLDAIGYGLVFFDQHGEYIDFEPDQRYEYRREEGPRRIDGGRTGYPRPENQNGVVVSGSALRALAAEEYLGADDLVQAKRLMRFVITPLLGDRPLMTRALFARPGPSARAPDPPE